MNRCRCCRYYTMTSVNSYDICPVCYWEDDPGQFQDPTTGGGANTTSLNVARENYQKYGACEEIYLEFVRKPLLHEDPDYF